MTFAIFASVELVTNTFLLVIVNYFERRRLMIAGISVEVLSLTCLLAASFSEEAVVYRVISSCFLRASMQIVYEVNYLYTAETFPTAIRQASMGTCSVFARIGSIVSPFVKELTLATSLSASSALYLSFATVNLLLVHLIPESRKLDIPDTIHQKKDVKSEAVQLNSVRL